MTIEYEDLDETNEEQENLDRGDFLEDEELDDQDDSEDDEGLEDDDESDPSDEEEDTEEEQDEDEGLQKVAKIPKSRLDEVIRQREEARERNAWLEEQLEKLINANLTKVEKEEVKESTKLSYDFDSAEENYIALILEGETAKAIKLRREIDNARAEEYKEMLQTITEKATTQAKSESNAAIEAEKFNTLISNFENKYKFLDYESDDYNEEAVDTVNTLLAGYVAAGKSKPEALKLAVSKVAPLYEKVSDKKVNTQPTLGNKRKVEAGKKAARAANSQPAKTKSVSTRAVDAETIRVDKMSEKDFSKLTAKEKSILRGDSF